MSHRADQSCKGRVRTSEAQETACLKVCGKKELSPFEEKKEGQVDKKVVGRGRSRCMKRIKEGSDDAAFVSHGREFKFPTI